MWSFRKIHVRSLWHENHHFGYLNLVSVDLIKIVLLQSCILYSSKHFTPPKLCYSENILEYLSWNRHQYIFFFHRVGFIVVKDQLCTVPHALWKQSNFRYSKHKSKRKLKHKSYSKFEHDLCFKIGEVNKYKTHLHSESESTFDLKSMPLNQKVLVCFPSCRVWFKYVRLT